VTLATPQATLPLPTVSTDVEASPGQTFAVAEFFAGIGLARLGLEQAKGLRVVWANDMAEKKKAMYVDHFGAEDSAHYVCADIKEIALNPVEAGLPTDLGLAWASFPCTDLSLAGGRKGLAGKHSGTFWDFTGILENLGSDKRPRVVALENVNGFATSHGGDDLRAAIKVLNNLDYSVDVLTLDARRWVPQSRPRLFLVASKDVPQLESDAERDTDLRPSWLDHIFESGLRTHRARLPAPPPLRKTGWTDLVSQIPDVDQTEAWWDEERMGRFCSELSDIQLNRVAELQKSGRVVYRTAYRRTRGGKPQWEIRADDLAGCLRTTGGGSSKQAVVRISPGTIQARWMSPREYAFLMGAADYKLGDHANQARMGFGDAVCVDAVAWLAENYLKPLLTGDLMPASE